MRKVKEILISFAFVFSLYFFAQAQDVAQSTVVVSGSQLQSVAKDSQISLMEVSTDKSQVFIPTSATMTVTKVMESGTNLPKDKPEKKNKTKKQKFDEELKTKFKERIDRVKTKFSDSKSQKSSRDIQDLKELNDAIIAEAKLQGIDVAEEEPALFMTLSETYIPNDTKVTSQWYLFNILEANKKLFNRSNVNKPIVAVIDAGVDFSNQDLQNQKWSGVCFDENNEKMVQVCDGGYDFVEEDFDTRPTDGATHGNAVSALIGAQNDNGVGIASLSKGDVSIMSLRVAENGMLRTDKIVRAIYFAVNNGAKVINMSFAGPTYSQELLKAIRYAENRGVVMVTAAGNYGLNLDTNPMYPASYANKNVITVGAIDKNISITSWSNYGKAVDLFAPGAEIITLTSGDSYANLNGTSFAAPITASYIADAIANGKDWRKSLNQLPNLGALRAYSKNGTVLGASRYSQGQKIPSSEIQIMPVKGLDGKWYNPQTKGGQIMTDEEVKNFKPQAANYSLSAASAPILYSPGNGTIQDASGGYIQYSWGSSSGAVKYSVHVRDLTTNVLILDTSLITTVTGNSYTHYYSYVPGRRYRWNMYAYDSAGTYSPISQSYEYTIAVPALPAPSSLSPGSTSANGPQISGSSVNLSWSSVANATGYYVEFTNVSTGATNNYSSAYTYQGVSLTAGNYYRWRVATVNTNAQYGSYSPYYYFQATPVTSNNAPYTPSISGSTSGAVNSAISLSFYTTDPESNNVAYEVNWNANAGSSATNYGWYSSGQTASISNTYTSAGTYCVRVRAYDPSGGYSGQSSCYNVTISQTASAPTLSVTPSTQTVTSGATANFTVSATNVSSCSLNGNGFVNAGLGTGGSFNFTPTTSGTYTVSCTGTNGSTVSANFTVNVTTTTTVAPSVPTLTGASTVVAGSNIVFSTNSTDPQGDQIYYRLNVNANNTTSYYQFGPYTSGSGLNITHVYTTPGTYCVKMQAVDVPGNASAWSNCLNVTVTAGSSETPSIPTVSGTGTGVSGTAYPASFYSTDPQGDQIYYDAQLTANWTNVNQFAYGPYNSGTTLTVNIGYSTGTYCLKARSRDSKGNASAWSNCHNVVISVTAPTTSGSIGTIGSQVLGTPFTITVNTTNVPTGSTITLAPSFGNIYPSSFTTSGNIANVNVYLTSVSGSVNIKANYNNTVIATSNTFTVTPSCTSTLQEFTLEGLCTPKNVSLANPKEVSPGSAASPGTQVNSSTQTFSWTAVSGASKYSLYVRDIKSGNLIIAEENLTNTYFTYNYLQPNTSYKWNVRAKDANGLGGWLSDSFYFTTGTFTVATDPNASGEVDIEVLDAYGLPVSDLVLTFECVDPAGSTYCKDNAFIQGTVKTGPDGKTKIGKDLIGRFFLVKTGFEGVNNQYTQNKCEAISQSAETQAKYTVKLNFKNIISKEVVLNAVSITISLCPGVGEVYDLYTLASGKDPITNEQLDTLGKFLTVGGLISGVGSGKVARIVGNDSLKAISRVAGHNVDDVLSVADEVASEIPLSTVDDIKTLFYQGSSNISGTFTKISTRSTYRTNLIKYIGLTTDAVKGFDAHHVMPQKFSDDFFSKLNINISDPKYMVFWKQTTGLSTSHRSMAKVYNDEWTAWFKVYVDAGGTPTKTQALQQAQKMFDKYKAYYQAPITKVDFTN